MIPVARPNIGKEEIEAVEEVLKSGMIAMGEKVFEFERKFSEYSGTKYGIGVCNINSVKPLKIIMKKIFYNIFHKAINKIK